MKVFYSARYIASEESFDTVAKSGWIADSLASRPIDGARIATPAPITPADLEGAHDPGYIDALRTGRPRVVAESQGLTWDPGLWTSIFASTGGVVAAALTALEEGSAGSLSSGLHHARRDTGSGFCSVNGLAVAAGAALREGAATVAILDLDAHCGGGTASIIGGNPRITQLDVSVSSFDSYPDTGNSTLWMVDRADLYLGRVEHALEQLKRLRPDLLLYNAGMDPHENCSIGGLRGITSDILAERERLVFEFCARESLPVAFVLAGGYIGTRLTADELVDLHRLTIAAGAVAARTRG
ncbi:arginase family protein [Lolliginicoccus suaedae]|uniref:hypothetical protein n=1 Tax=Lolliginicoccus suaedae TaxID=2605429 RepID=UPI0011EEE23D|nr:hypothetical protein [Lolliginicoccus suaedae]